MSLILFHRGLGLQTEKALTSCEIVAEMGLMAMQRDCANEKVEAVE